MDIIQNSIVANATKICITYSQPSSHKLEIVIEDNGKGMTEAQAQSALNPFFTTRTTRDIGLGIPLFKMSAENTGGSFSLESTLGKGTKISAAFDMNHIDMIPLGDTASTLLLLITGNPDIDFVFKYSTSTGSFEVITQEIKEILDGLPISSPEVTTWLKGYLSEGFDSLGLT